MASNLNPNTINFDELTNHWSSGDNVYGSGCQLTDTSLPQIFKLAFSDTSDTFFDELLKNKESSSPSSSSSTDTEYTISSWNKKPSSDKNISIKQRKLTIKATESGIAFFLRKNITTNITQTAFIQQDCITIYSVAQTRTESKESDHTVIDRWTIKTADNDSQRVFVAINANIKWKSYQTPTSTIIKSKWLRFYQSRFETWRELIKRYIDSDNAKSEKNVLMEPYVGIYNKLKSFHTINIMSDKIEYSDGSRFGVKVDAETKEIIATYANNTFSGKLHEAENHEEIRWNNGSIWVKNGFQRFEGDYIHQSTQQKYIVDKSGTIKLPITGREIRFILLAPNRISYQFNRDIVHKGTLIDGVNIKWDNGSFWEKQSKQKPNPSPIVKQATDPLFEVQPQIKPQTEEQSQEPQEPQKEVAAEIERKEAEQSMDVMEGGDTVEIRGEVEKEEDITNGESDFEHDFDEYLKEQKMPSLEIHNDAHFVLVNDDELFDVKILEKEEDEMNNKPDEWLLV